MRVSIVICFLIFCQFLPCGPLTGQLQAEDASALEAQYKTCAKHYIPAEKCTPEIYQQLKDKDNAPLDATAAAALKAVKEYQTRAKNPDSVQVRTAYVTDEGAVCLEIGAQNGAGGMSVSRAHLRLPTQKHIYCQWSEVPASG
jgi:hypothetical protein